jgi:WD40 repeat protein
VLPFCGCGILPVDETLVSTGTDRTLRFWRLPKGESTKTLTLPKDFDALLVRYAANGQLVTGSAQGKLVLRDGQNGEEVKELASYPHGFKALVLSPDGKYVAGGTAAGEIVVLAAATGKETLRWKGHSAAVLELAFFADSQTLAATPSKRSSLGSYCCLFPRRRPAPTR